MVISAAKTKSMTTSKTSIRCNLVVDDKIIHQEGKVKQLGIDTSGYRDVEAEVRNQAARAMRTAAHLNNTIWWNKHIRTEAKARIYKTAIRPILTYAAETRPETSKIKRILETSEMKIAQRIAGKTLMDRIRSDNMRQTCGIDKINDWVLERNKKLNEYIDDKKEL